MFIVMDHFDIVCIMPFCMWSINKEINNRRHCTAARFITNILLNLSNLLFPPNLYLATICVSLNLKMYFIYPKKIIFLINNFEINKKSCPKHV